MTYDGPNPIARIAAGRVLERVRPGLTEDEADRLRFLRRLTRKQRRLLNVHGEYDALRRKAGA